MSRMPFSGGAIALGHPVGLGVVSMCIGGGQALAALFRRV